MINVVVVQIIHQPRVLKETLKLIGYLKINVLMHMLTLMMMKRVLYDAVIQAQIIIYSFVKEKETTFKKLKYKEK